MATTPDVVGNHNSKAVLCVTSAWHLTMFFFGGDVCTSGLIETEKMFEL